MNVREPDTPLIPLEKQEEESNRSRSKMKPCIGATTSTSSAPSAKSGDKVVKKGSLHV
ncbi:MULTISPECIES: hypothetical protein [Thermofilum]|uniref:Uncharacterized protein n=1 Tax=Thermofilum adornatum TaxID=1365176 RepID=S5Z982_9CREN|nr:hypothetical protein [Thermofilum adornatum]AGT35930.1 hypothetical protein N186_07960 [Thermofilum adornatum]